MAATGRHLGNPVESLRYATYRRYWWAHLLTTNSNWMDTLVRGWLVYELTGSASQLALVTATKSLPLLAIALFAGAIADRFNRRNVLATVQGLISVTHALLGVLIVTGHTQLWHVYATAASLGVARAIQGPARHALLPSMVPREQLHNAVVLSNATGSIGQTTGPMLGGLLIPFVGFGPSFLIQAALNVTAGGFTLLLPSPATATGARERGVFGSIGDGFAYVRGNRVVLLLLVVALVPLFLAYPHVQLLPAIAEEVLAVGPTQTGALFAAAGAGSFASLAALSFVRSLRRRGALVLGSVIVLGAAVAVIGVSPSFSVALAMVLLAGVARGVYRAVNHSMILLHTDDAFLGRVNSIYHLDRGLVPLGTVAVGVLADVAGVGTAIFVGGALCALCGAGAATFSADLRRA